MYKAVEVKTEGEREINGTRVGLFMLVGMTQLHGLRSIEVALPKALINFKN